MGVNKMQSPPRVDRRGWLVSSARLALFAAIAGFSGGLWLKSRRLRCGGQPRCGQCSRLGFCRLPEAAEARRKEEG